jgi:hypothetical protein
MNAMKKMLLLLLFLPPLAWAAKAHEHGVVKLNITVEQNQVNISMVSSLDGVVGFERVPRTPAEKAKVEDAVSKLSAADKFFKLEAAASCRSVKTTLTAPVIGVGVAAPVADVSGHGDLEGEFVFECQDANKVSQIEVVLFDAFPGMRRIDVQAVTSLGQIKRTLRRGQRPGGQVVSLSRPK